MANKVIRSSTVSQSWDVEYSVSQEKSGASAARGNLNPITELTITPKKGYIVDAKDFMVNYLPPEVENVRYENTSNKINEKNRVKAIVRLKHDFIMPRDFVNIDIKIIGEGRSPSNYLKLTVNIPEHDNVIVNTMSLNGLEEIERVVNNNIRTITYAIAVRSVVKRDILKIDVQAADGGYLSVCDYKLTTKHLKNYKVKSEIRKSNKYNTEAVTRKSIAFSFKFPEGRTISANDILDLTIEPSKIVRDDYSEDYNADGTCSPGRKKKKQAIYSYSTSNVSSFGGNQIATVTGIPGSKFKLLIQDSSKLILDATTGAFGAGGTFIEGIIPKEKNGKRFGVYKLVIPRPTSNAASSNDVEARIITDGDVVNPLTIKDIPRINVEGGDIDTALISKQKGTAKMTFSFAGTGMTVEQYPEELAGQSTSLVIGPGVTGEYNSRSYVFDLIIIATASANKMYIPRQPRVAYGATYAAWGASGSDKLYKNLDSSGDRVNMDLNISDNKSHEYVMTATAEGFGESKSLTLSGEEVAHYPAIRLKGSVSGIVYGTDDITPALNLLNFLSTIAV